MLAIGCAGAAAAQTCGRWLFGPGQERADLNGAIADFTTWDPDGPGPEGEWLVIGGSFQGFGTSSDFSTNSICGPVVAWDGGSYRTFGSPTEFSSGSVSAVGTCRGDLYVARSDLGGVFRWNGTNWDLVGTSLLGTVTRLLEFRGELIAIGSGVGLAEGTSSAAVRLRNGEWEHLGVPTTGALGFGGCVYRDELVVAGKFTSAGGVPARNIAKWDGTSWSALGEGLTGTSVSDVLMHDGRLIAVGEFTGSGATQITNVASWDGESWTAVGIPPSFPGMTRATMFEGRLHVLDAGCRPYRWDGADWTSLVPPGALVSSTQSGAMAAYHGDLIVGGEFTVTFPEGPYAFNWIVNVARYTRGTVLGLGLGVQGVVGSLTSAVAFNGSLILGGDVNNASGKTTRGAARWDGINLDSMGPLVPNFPPNFVVAWKDRLIAAGPINGLLRVGGGPAVQAVGYVQWNGSAWAPFGTGNVAPTALAVCNDVLTEGRTTRISGVTYGQVRQWSGSAWLPVGGLADSTIHAIAQLGETVIAAGKFQNFEDKPVARIARWNGSTWEAMGDGFDNTVWALHVHGGELYAAGAFTMSGATPVNRIARWDGAAWLAVAQGFNDEVFKMHTHKGELIASGKFTSSGSTPVSRIARLRGGAWTPLGGGLASTGGAVFGLATYRDELIVVGSFTQAAGQRSFLWARWTDDGVGDIIDQPVGETYSCGTRVVLSVRQMNGYTPMRAEWLRDGQPFDFSEMRDVRQIDSGGRSILIFDHIDARRAGSYTCRLINDCGSVESDAASVGVLGACCPGDMNSDGLVDDLDFQLFVQQYAIMDCFDPDMPPLCLADLDLDSFVTDDDFLMFLSEYDAMLCYP
jgi:hypothetical protein